MLEGLEPRFASVAPNVDFCSLRFFREREQMLSVRQNVPQPVWQVEDAGAMVTVIHRGGLGYAATSDLSVSGLKHAVNQAVLWAHRTAGCAVVDFGSVSMPRSAGEYIGPAEQPWETVPVNEKMDLLHRQCQRLRIGDPIVDWEASLSQRTIDTLYLTSHGARVYQRFSLMAPDLRATANEKAVTQNRTLGGRGYCQQGGMEVLERIGFSDAAPGIAQEAVQLLSVPNCPTGTMDVVLAPDQMILQIHESIGHPLELDRILGDERNYAGTSFVTLDMFGQYRYGSDLLNITFDPSRPEQFATSGYDDDGLRARKEYIIQKGLLVRGLGGVTSQARSGSPGVANSRASSWNRPPIDRMANLNLEPGDASLDRMIALVKRGIYMKTNCSWSIDDSRNKFQFGCEWGQMIEDGRLTRIVRNPNYRGVSATFWRNLKMVGNDSTTMVLGTPSCGKGEPNQVMWVGHASPTCVFSDVEVFGGV
jgi:predicted Zn-dependent protease